MTVRDVAIAATGWLVLLVLLWVSLVSTGLEVGW